MISDRQVHPAGSHRFTALEGGQTAQPSPKAARPKTSSRKDHSLFDLFPAPIKSQLFECDATHQLGASTRKPVFTPDPFLACSMQA